MYAEKSCKFTILCNRRMADPAPLITMFRIHFLALRTDLQALRTRFIRCKVEIDHKARLSRFHTACSSTTCYHYSAKCYFDLSEPTVSAFTINLVQAGDVIQKKSWCTPSSFCVCEGHLDDDLKASYRPKSCKETVLT